MTALDTNALVALLEGTAESADHVVRAIEVASGDDPVTVCAAVYAEFCAGSQRDANEVALHLRRAGIEIDTHMGFELWREAAVAFAAYSAQRRRSGADGPRRILANFIIGAHANATGSFVTADAEFFRRAFPALRIVDPNGLS